MYQIRLFWMKEMWSFFQTPLTQFPMGSQKPRIRISHKRKKSTLTILTMIFTLFMNYRPLVLPVFRFLTRLKC